MDVSDMNDLDAHTLVKHVRSILELSDALAKDGIGAGHSIYVAARNVMDMLTQDQVTRDVVKRLTETTTVMNINGYDIPEEVVDLVKQGRPINAIKELRTKYDLDLYSAKQITDKILEKIG